MTTCTLTENDLFGSIYNPATQAGFLNANYSEPSAPGSPWSIKIYYNDTAYQFNYFYGVTSDGRGSPMEIVSQFGERGYARFSICDYDEDETILPFIPVEEMLVEIYNITEDRLYFKGYTQDIEPSVLAVRADNTEAAIYTITCTDLFHELERRPVRKVYTSKTLGFILRDVLTRFTNIDASEIDANLGFTVDNYPINAKTPAQVLTHIMDLTDSTYYIDPSTSKIYVLPKQDGGIAFNTQITDSNVYDYFYRDTFSLRRQNVLIKNQIEFWFSERYTKGTVNVSNASNIVVAYGGTPETEWDDLPAGLQFKLQSSDAVYNVEKNNSSGATQEIRLSSTYQETTATDQAYELRGNRRRVFVSDEESVGTMRSLRGDDGIFTYVVSEDSNFFTWAEARRFASALLSLSRPLPQGGATTWNDIFTEEGLFAGKVFNVDLLAKRRYVGDIVCQQVTLTDQFGDVDIGGETHPYLRIDFGFTATLSQQQTQMKKIMQDLRKVKVNLDDVAVEDYAQIRETLGMKDCVHGNTPTSVTEELTLTDSIATRDALSEGPLFYTDQHYLLNEIDYSFTSD